MLVIPEPLRDLGYAPSVGLQEMVGVVLAAHDDRNLSTAEAFALIDIDGSGTLTRVTTHTIRRRLCFLGRF